MDKVVLGKTGIEVNKNGFGALPIQRISKKDAVYLLQKAFYHGVDYFDTARAYSDSEEKMGAALSWVRDRIVISTKTAATDVETFWKDLETSLGNLQTDYIDIYQFHNPAFCPKPGDGTGLYEAMEEAKATGKIRHIGITNHRLAVAREAIESGLYETLQFPFSYLASGKDREIVDACREAGMGFIAMKGLAGGLIRNSACANLEAVIQADRGQLSGDFCRGCGYCMPCPAGIKINDCARMSLMIRRAPQAAWVSQEWQEEMKKIENCLHCGQCKSKCPYGLDTPELLAKNYEDYKTFL